MHLDAYVYRSKIENIDFWLCDRKLLILEISIFGHMTRNSSVFEHIVDA